MEVRDRKSAKTFLRKEVLRAFHGSVNESLKTLSDIAVKWVKWVS